jgi:multiple sugar transport system substrate-binding protein
MDRSARRQPSTVRLAGGLALLVVVALAVVSSSSGQTTATQRQEVVNLTFWSWVPGVDKAVALWNSTHPDVQVKLEKIPPGGAGGYAKMHAAVKAGNAPDLAQVEYQNIPGFLLDEELVELSQHGANRFKSKFVGWQWQQGVFGSRVYAIPQASGPMGFYYRQDVFDKLKLKAPATWADYEVAARKIHTANPKMYIGTFPPANSAWFTALAWQAGAKWFGTRGENWTVNIDNAATRKVASYWDRLRKQGLIKTAPDFSNAWYKDLQVGNIVGWVSAQWGDAILVGNAPKTAGKWRVAYLPQWKKGARASANWGGSSTALLRGTDNPKEALDFAVWLNSDPKSIDLLIQGGYGWPAATAAFKGSALDKASSFFGGQRYNDVFAVSDKNIDVSWGWIPTVVDTYQHLNNGFTAAVSGKGTFVSALKTAQQLTIRDMKAKGLKVVAGR